MSTSNNRLRSWVLTWTVLTTTFFWTTTMRMLFKPEISDWSLFSVGGKGLSGSFWLPPLVALLAVGLFYLEGRGKWRTLYHAGLISWQLALTALIAYGSWDGTGHISFGTWGITLDFYWLLLPVVIFVLLAVLLVSKERKSPASVPQHPWTSWNRRPFLLALLLLPSIILFFRLGTGFNWQVKLAVGACIVQWILLTEAVGRPYASTETVSST